MSRLVQLVHIVAIGLLPPSLVGQPRVMEADNLPIWGSSLSLVEEVRIGTLDGDIDYSLGRVGGVVALRDGSIWISDQQLAVIRRYSSDGIFLGQVGREGEGPGEFRRPSSMRLLPDGSVVVWDPGQARVSRFSPDGSLLGSLRAPSVVITEAWEMFEADTVGHLHILGSRPSGGPGATGEMFWVETTADGEVVDSLAAPPRQREGWVDPLITVSAVSPLGYVVVGRNEGYTFGFEDDGVEYLIERPGRRVPYEPAERREKQRLEDLFAERRGESARQVPAEKPVFSDFRLDASGRLWVRVYVRGQRLPEDEAQEAERRRSCERFGIPPEECDRGAREWTEPVVYEVIQPDGRYLGRLRFPGLETRVVWARENRVWVVEDGPFGEEYVVQYRVEPGG